MGELVHPGTSVPSSPIRQLTDGRAIYCASHNGNLISMLDALWDKSDRYRRMGLMLPPGDDARERDLAEHHKMVAMMIDRDAQGVVDLMRQHIKLSLTFAAMEALEMPPSAR